MIVFVFIVLTVVLLEEVHALCLNVEPRQFVVIAGPIPPYGRKEDAFYQSTHLHKHLQQQRAESLKVKFRSSVHIDGVESAQHVIQSIRCRVEW